MVWVVEHKVDMSRNQRRINMHVVMSGPINKTPRRHVFEFELNMCEPF
jgi:hypothetical protein